MPTPKPGWTTLHQLIPNSLSKRIIKEKAITERPTKSAVVNELLVEALDARQDSRKK